MTSFISLDSGVREIIMSSNLPNGMASCVKSDFFFEPIMNLIPLIRLLFLNIWKYRFGASGINPILRYPGEDFMLELKFKKILYPDVYPLIASYPMARDKPFRW